MNSRFSSLATFVTDWFLGPVGGEDGIDAEKLRMKVVFIFLLNRSSWLVADHIVICCTADCWAHDLIKFESLHLWICDCNSSQAVAVCVIGLHTSTVHVQ